MNSASRLLTACHIFVFLLTFFLSKPAHAFFTSSVDINWGFSNYSLKALDFKKNLQSPAAIEVGYNLMQASSGIAYNMTFFEMLSTNDGYLNYTSFSVGVRYYPYGSNGSKTVLDNETQAIIWKTTPFVGLNLGLANCSVKEFNATLMEISPRFGAEIPITANILMLGQLVFTKGNSSGGSSLAVSANGATGLLGIILTTL